MINKIYTYNEREEILWEDKNITPSLYHFQQSQLNDWTF